ncbi:MAG: hypothetical protein ACE5EC_06555 [Phycisphaerae bacterium]
MRPHRKIILALTILLAGGSLGFTATYAVRLHSEAYRVEVERDLGAFFELPCELGRVRGRTFDSRAFEDLVIYLPDRRDKVFSCQTAIWHEQERGGEEVRNLDLINGVLILGSDKWVHDDYRTVIRSGLDHDFEELRLSEVRMTDFDIRFDRGDLSIRCSRASGLIDMRDPGTGVARLHAYELNGYPVRDGVRIHALFSPKNGVEISELVLSLPEVPLASIDFGSALAEEITRGRFAGRVEYRDTGEDQPPEIRLAGDLVDADLSELTCQLPFGPLEGDISINVYDARFAGSIITHFQGRGRINDFTFAAFAPLLKLPGLSGSASFNLDPVDISLGRINRLRIDGLVRDLSLEELLHVWGKGSATGRLTIRVNNLDLVDDNIKSADIEITALPPEGGTGTLDRTLILGLAEKVLNFTWPSALPQNLIPDQLEYTQFGMRLLVKDNKLRILGTHGEDGDTILTIRVRGYAFGLVKEQSGTTDLTPYLADLLRRIREYDPDRVREWWESQGE